MKIIKPLTLSICLLGSLSVLSQSDFAFRVLANKGANEVKSGETWQQLKTGAQLKLGDELKISENASVGLVSKNGKPLEIKEAKTYQVADLFAKVGTEKSVLNKYTDFILSSNSAEAKKNRLSATGAVHRGLDAIKVLLPFGENQTIFNSSLVVHWQMEKPAPPYRVMLKNKYDEVLWKTETAENSVEINLNDLKLANEQTLLLEIKSKAISNCKSEQYLIQRLSPDNSESVKADLNKVETDLNENTAFNKYLLSGFYEGHQLLIDAITCFEQAIKLDPENLTYREAYEEFLLRNKIK